MTIDAGFEGDDNGDGDGRPSLVTPLYRRGTLFDAVVRGGPLSPVELASAGRHLTYALETLHCNGVVHADVRPEKVFIGDGHTLVLGDLGATWLGADGRRPYAPTPPYAAPEIWLGGMPTVAADLYALGATLLFAATGRVPMAGAPPEPDRAAARLGDAAVLLASDPARRPPSAAHAARAFGPGDVHDPWRTPRTVAINRAGSRGSAAGRTG